MTIEQSDLTLADNQETFDREIAPLIEKIKEVCQAHRLPFVAVFQTSGEGDLVLVTQLYAGTMAQLGYVAAFFDPDIAKEIVISTRTQDSSAKA